MEYVALVNGKFSHSKGALVHCTCNQLYWVGWNKCPSCHKTQEENRKQKK